MTALPRPPVFVLAALLALGACGGGPPPAPKTRPPPLVTVAKVTVQDVPLEIVSPVELRAYAQADVVSKAVGYLDAVLFDRGDRVRAGQVVATVRPSDLPDQLAASRGALAQMQAAGALAKANLGRAEALAPAGRVSQAELEQARATVAQAEAQEASVRAQAAAIATRLGETRLLAPFDGVVTVRRLDPGVLVGPGTATGAVMTVARVDSLRASVTVNERDSGRVALGQETHVVVDALPGRLFQGKLARIAPSFDPVSRTLDVEVRLPNGAGELRPGMYGRGAVVTGVHPGALTVPVTAVQIVRGKRWVFVLAGDKVRRTSVETGVDGEDWLEVTRGLEANAEVVTAGADGLADGVTVRVARNVDPFTGAATGNGPQSQAR